jgi:hypothetical protein
MPLGGCVIRLASGAPPRDVRPAYTADQRSPPGEHRELEGGLFVLGGQARVTPPATGSEVPKR